MDECHRTQSGKLHEAMKEILPNAMFIGFTGTPLLKADKQNSIEIFGSYIHTYKYDEAVRDGVVLDLRYEARDIDQDLTSPEKIDQWFEAKTRGLTDVARPQLKQRWGTMQKVLSSKSRLEQIVADILLDMETRDRLQSGRGNALLVSGSIYQACKFYELFTDQGFDKCAIVTSYKPIAGRYQGRRDRRRADREAAPVRHLQQDAGRLFQRAGRPGHGQVEEFEKEVKKKFVNEPGQMKLLIVVDKLLTGFDAPPATYLYIDKQMQDHGLFQAICRVNRLDGDDKEYGYIVDYKDLFKSLERSVHDYTSERVRWLRPGGCGRVCSSDRLEKAKEQLEEAREAIKALCEPVAPPQGHRWPISTTSAPRTPPTRTRSRTTSRSASRSTSSPSSLIRAYANLANEMPEAGYTPHETAAIKREVEHLREGAQRGQAGQRRLHRPEDVRTGHAPPDRHLHPGRREREGLGL